MTPSALAVEELAARSEDEVREHLAAGKLVEGLQHMSPDFLPGSTASSRSRPTPSSSARPPTPCRPARAGLNNFGSAVSIIQDELAHAHIGYRLSATSASTWTRLIYEREPAAFKYPYAFDLPLDSWTELVLANALYDQAGFVLLSATYIGRGTYGPWKRALAKVDKEETFHLRHGRTWVRKLCADPDEKRAAAGVAGLDVHPHARVVRATRRPQTARGSSSSTGSRVWAMTSSGRRGWARWCPSVDEVGLDVPAHWDEDARALRRWTARSRPASTRTREALAPRGRADQLGRRDACGGRRAAP